MTEPTAPEDAPPAPASEDVAAEFETAMAARDGQRAVALFDRHPDKQTAMLRAFNMLAYGIDRATPLGLEEVKDLNEQCAERGVNHIIARHGSQRTCDEPLAILYDTDITGGPIHVRDAPWICYRLVVSESLTPEAARSLAAWAWTMCEFPEANFEPDGWRLVFWTLSRDGRGILTDADPDHDRDPNRPPLDVPDAPVRLYRGAVAARADGMTWTGSHERATWFAERFNGALDDTARVYTAVVEPHRIYARFDGRGEDEYVIDTRGLAIDEVPDEHDHTPAPDHGDDR